MTHLCLARPEEGHSAPGDQFDCPECRVVLLDAFRDPATPPLPTITSTPGAQSSPLLVPDPGRTVYLSPSGRCLDPELCSRDEPCPECERARQAPCAPVWGVHFTPGLRSGIWRAVCNCGWRKEGPFLPGGAPRAEQVAKEWAQSHLTASMDEEDGR